MLQLRTQHRGNLTEPGSSLAKLRRVWRREQPSLREGAPGVVQTAIFLANQLEKKLSLNSGVPHGTEGGGEFPNRLVVMDEVRSGNSGIRQTNGSPEGLGNESQLMNRGVQVPSPATGLRVLPKALAPSDQLLSGGASGLETQLTQGGGEGHGPVSGLHVSACKAQFRLQSNKMSAGGRDSSCMPTSGGSEGGCSEPPLTEAD